MELDLHSSFLWTACFFLSSVSAEREKIVSLVHCELNELYASFFTRKNELM